VTGESRKIFAGRRCECFDLGATRFLTEAKPQAQQRCRKFALRGESLSAAGVEVLSKPDAGIPPAPDSSSNLNLA